MRGWGTLQVRIGGDAASVQQQVEIEGSRAIGDRPLPAVLLLDGEQGPRSSREGGEAGAHQRHRIQEARAGPPGRPARFRRVEEGTQSSTPGQPADGRHSGGDEPAPVSQV